MKRLYPLLCFVCLLFPQHIHAQNTMEIGFGGLLNKGFIGTANYTKSDSLKQMEKMSLTAQFGMRSSFRMHKKWQGQIGLGYSRYNSKFIRTNLKFHDSIHPELGRIEDLSEAATKSVVYKYNFNYLTIPVNFLYALDIQKGNNFFIPFVVVGFDNQILLQHKLRVETKGFTMKGENVHKIENTGWVAQEYTMNLNLGSRFEIKLDKSAKLTIQPELKIPVLSSTTSNPQMRYGALGIWFGLAKII